MGDKKCPICDCEINDGQSRIMAYLDSKQAVLATIHRKCLTKEIQQLRQQLEQSRNQIQEMVDKAANNHLEGYREMGRKLAEKDEQLKQAEADKWTPR